MVNHSMEGTSSGFNRSSGQSTPKRNKHKKFKQRQEIDDEVFFDQLEQEIESKTDSGVKLVEATLEVPLKPRLLTGDELSTCKDVINSRRFKQVSKLGGILLGIKHLSLASDVGLIKDLEPFVYWSVTGTFYVLSPREGSVLRGSIKQIGQLGSTSITCWLYDCIPVSVKIPSDSTELSSLLCLDAVIPFEVLKERMSLTGVLLGSVTDQCLEIIRRERSC